MPRNRAGDIPRSTIRRPRPDAPGRRTNRRAVPSAALGCLLALALHGAAPDAHAAPSFTGLPATFSVVDVSGDGRVAVGSFVNGDGHSEAGIWTAENGVLGLGDVPGDGFDSGAKAASADGSVIVGEGTGPGGIRQAFQWSEGTGLVPLSNLPFSTGSTARAVSSDGQVIGGDTLFPNFSTEPTRWDQGPSPLGFATQGGEVLSVSGDGSTLVGESRVSGDSPGVQVTLWKAGMETRLGFEGTPRGVSEDGSIIIGDGSGGAFRWADDTLQLLGFLDGGASSGANDLTADGSVVVGFSGSGAGNRAFIWDDGSGMRDLKDFLETDGGLDLTGWTLEGAQAISDNGLVIAGHGTSPLGQNEAWIAVIPEPSTGLLLATGLLGLAATRRSRRSFKGAS